MKLTKEHILPYSLGADAYLGDASCIKCADITKRFEQHLARNVFGHHRIHRGIQTRQPEQRPSKLSARIVRHGIEHRHELDILDHPYFLAMPIWDQPQMLRGLKPSENYYGMFAHLFYRLPDKIRVALQLGDDESVEIKPDSKIDVNQFGRALAKIAFCNAIATLPRGSDSFDPLDLPALIRGEYPYIPFYVGSVIRNPPQPNRTGALHRIDIGINWVLDPQLQIWRRILISKIRLFATDGFKTHGMPIYTVVTGTPKWPL